MEVDHRGDVEPLPIEAKTIAQHHLHGRTLCRDRQPDRWAEAMHWDRHGVDARAKPLESLRGRTHQSVARGHRLRVTKSFLDDCDAQSSGAAAQRLTIGLRLAAVLTGIEAIRTG